MRSKPVIRVATGFFFCTLSITSLRAQQVSHADLREQPTRDQSRDDVPELLRSKECPDREAGALVDGMVESDVPRQILLAITRVSSAHPELGGEIDAEVMLKNIGPAQVTIPWTSDPDHLNASEDDNYKEWETGEFVLSLRASDTKVRLKSLSGNLFSSRFSNGSALTLRQGEWITATLKVRLEAESPKVDGAIEPGKGDLVAEWRQIQRTYKRVGCQINAGFFPYKKVYQQKQEALALVTTKRIQDK